MMKAKDMVEMMRKRPPMVDKTIAAGHVKRKKYKKRTIAQGGH